MKLKGRPYLDSILYDDKYLDYFDEMYNQFYEVESYRIIFSEIEQDLLNYVSDISDMNSLTPDYAEFKRFAFNKYLPKPTKGKSIDSNYLHLTGSKKPHDIKIDYYYCCLLLLFHIAKLEDTYFEQVQIDVDKLPQEEMKRIVLLHDKRKLLTSFFYKWGQLIKPFVSIYNMKNTKHLDDNIRDLEPQEIKHRLMVAILMRNRTMALKLVGRLRDLDLGEDYYFEALSHYINEEYSECIRYASMLNKDEIDYGSAISLKLECLSLLGDLDGYHNCLIENKEYNFNRAQLAFQFGWLMLIADDIEPILQWDDLIQIFTIKNEVILEDTDSYYVDKIYILMTTVMLEAIELLENINQVSTLTGNLDVPKDKLERLDRLKMVLSGFGVHSLIINRLSVKFLRQKGIKKIKDFIGPQVLNNLIYNGKSITFERYHAAVMFIYKLGHIEEFLTLVDKEANQLVKFAENGYSGAKEILRIAYMEGSIVKRVNQKIIDYVSDSGVDFDPEDAKSKMIHRNLSIAGKTAFESAEWIYSKSKEIDYSWRDAGMISLSYFRIIELELNQKLVVPLMSHYGKKAFDSDYESHMKTLSGNEKQLFKNKWSRIKRGMDAIEKNMKNNCGLMLGEIYNLCKFIGSEFEQSDPLANTFKSKLNLVLNQDGITRFDNGFFEMLTCEETRNKFRNPPAHTQYLSYEVACECRNTFYNSMIDFHEMLIGTADL